MLLPGFAVVLACAAGCARSPQTHTAGPAAPARPAIALKAAPATPMDREKEKFGWATWNPRWDAVVEKALSPAMLGPSAARAVRPYCPRFATLPEPDRRAFWAYTFQALAGAEAGLNPDSSVHHLDAAVNTTDPVTHHLARQQGLLQLKYEDDRRYGCDFDWERDRRLPVKDPERTILNPARNLECGVRIMENQIVTQHKPLVTRTSYWATLQPGTEGHRVFSKQMANVPAYCRAVVKHAKLRRTPREQAAK